MEMNATFSIYNSITMYNTTCNTVCFDSPPHTVSDGFWVGEISGRSPIKSLLPVFELQVLVIFVVTEIFNLIFQVLGLPVFVSQMAAGLFLSSLYKKKWGQKISGILFPYGTHSVISSISSFGYVFFIFLNGVQMDFSLIIRTGKKPWAIAASGLLTPIIIGYPIIMFLKSRMEGGFGGTFKDIYVALTSNCVTMFAVIASLLNELEIQNSELGRLALSTALVMDILSTIFQSNLFVIYNIDGFSSALTKFIALCSLVILIPLVCRPAMFWIIKHTPEGRPVRSVYLHLIVILVLVFGWCSIKIEQDFVLGAFIFGLSVPEGPPLGSALVKKFKFFANQFLLPLFVTTSVMKVDISVLLEENGNLLRKIITYIIIFTHLVKLVSCLIPAICSKMPFKDAFTLSLILNCKGVVEIGVYCGLIDDKIISGQGYTVMMVSVMIIASIVQLSVKFLYDPSTKYAGYERTNIMNLKPNSELKIVACIHKPHHISPIIDILDLCYPISESPIIVDALHLVELVGSSLPIFIPHGIYRKNIGGYQNSSVYSDDVILAFDIYEHANMGAAKVNTYTAISPSHLMYEDICRLALDKVASIIFLPFHQRWKSDGSIEFDDKKIRTLNKKVLEISPCSVGILVTRSNKNLIKEPSNTRLAMIFLSGKDDREGLCLAKRASKNPSIQLMVYHLMSDAKDCKSEDEKLHDKAVLRDIYKGVQNVTYHQIIVNNGSQTASFLRDIVNEHDYFIVGRRHGINSLQTQGLSDWSEFPELGAIGDYLASPDFKASASILVVEQQVSKR